MSDLKQEVAQQATGQLFPVSVVAGSILGIPISSVVMWLTLVYLLFQIAVILPKVKGAIRKLRGKDEQCK